MGLQETMRALSDPTRRKILMLLRQNSLASGEIAAQFDMSGAAVSKHLGVLRAAELVRERRDGRYIIYELNATVLEEALLWLHEIRGDENEKV